MQREIVPSSAVLRLLVWLRLRRRRFVPVTSRWRAIRAEQGCSKSQAKRIAYPHPSRAVRARA